MPQPQHGERNLPGLRSGKPHNANASAARRRGDRDDGVIQIHAKVHAPIVTGKLMTTNDSHIRVPHFPRSLREVGILTKARSMHIVRS